jgi:hypothetical protein
VLDAPSGCDAGSCPVEVDGKYLYRVEWLALGKCTVTVTFSDGSPPLVQSMVFSKICPT